MIPKLIANMTYGGGRMADDVFDQRRNALRAAEARDRVKAAIARGDELSDCGCQRGFDMDLQCVCTRCGGTALAFPHDDAAWRLSDGV